MDTTGHALLVLSGYQDSDLSLEEYDAKTYKRLHGAIEAHYISATRFEFASSRPDGEPHTVTHDGSCAWTCTCEGAAIYMHTCWAMKRTNMILRKRAARERQAPRVVITTTLSDHTTPLSHDEVKGVLSSAMGKPFSLLR